MDIYGKEELSNICCGNEDIERPCLAPLCYKLQIMNVIPQISTFISIQTNLPNICNGIGGKAYVISSIIGPQTLHQVG